MQTNYELRSATGKGSAIFLISCAIFLILIHWLVLRLTNMRFWDLFSIPWVQPLGFVEALVAAGGALLITKLLAPPNHVRVTLDDDSITTVVFGHGGHAPSVTRKVAFADVERLWYPASGNMLVLSRGKKWLLSLGFSLLDRDTRSPFENLVRDLKTRMGVQEAAKRNVWWRPGLGGTEYRNPGFRWRDIPLADSLPVSDSKFIALWILATASGMLIGLIAGAAATLIVFGISIVLSGDRSSGSSSVVTAAGVVLSNAVGALVVGSIIGAAQRRVLNRRMTAKIRWAMASSLGLAGGVLASGAAFFAADYVPGATELLWNTSEPLQAAAGGLLAGSIWSVAQWVVLRRHLVRAGRWVLVNAAAAAVAGATAMSLILPVLPRMSDPQAGFISWIWAVPGLLGGAVVWSALTGIALTWLLRRPQ
jgi:hypothetical protein